MQTSLKYLAMLKRSYGLFFLCGAAVMLAFSAATPLSVTICGCTPSVTDSVPPIVSATFGAKLT